MAESRSPLDPDTQPPAVLGKMDALIARHRGSGIDPNVPVLTDLDPADAFGDIPVLTHVAPMVGDDLMFTPEEIRAEAPVRSAIPATPAPSPVPTPAAPPRTAPPASARPAAPDLINAPDLAAKAKPAAPVTVKAPDFDFPDLTIPVAKPPAPPPAPAPLAGVALMPDLALNFDFALPEEPAPAPTSPSPVAAAVPPTAPAAPPVIVPVAVPTPPAPVAAQPAATVAPPAPAPQPSATAPAAAQLLVSDAYPELTLEVPAELPAAPSGPAIDPAALAAELMAGLRPELEKLVRTELTRQVAALHAESIKRTLGALQPQLDKLISSRIEDALKRHG